VAFTGLAASAASALAAKAASPVEINVSASLLTMRIPRPAIIAIQLCILLGITVGLYTFYRSHDKELPIIDDDDVNVTSQVTVETGKITQRMLRQYADVYGVIEPQPARGDKPAAGASIFMPMAAQVASINCVEGSHVQAGQLLLQLDSPALQIALSQATAFSEAAERADSAAQNDSSVSPRDKLRFARDAADRSADVLAAKSALDCLAIKSPVSGTVLKLNVRAGESPPLGSVLLEIADENRLVVNCTTQVGDLPDIHPGDAAEVMWNATVSPAKVTFIDPAVDPISHAASVDVSLVSATTQPLVHPLVGQIVHVRLITEQHDALAVPESAVVQDAQGHANISMVVRDFRWAVRREVQTGLHDQGYVEISGPGLAVDQAIVTTGSNALTDKCRIEVTR
jgi:RND family efflux transporter MFP subunit